MKKQLVVLAAGMGSRYGGLKQMDPVGPSGEFIPDYSVYDAIRAGFTEVVYIIRRDIERDFREIVGDRWQGKASVKYAFQGLDDLPDGFAPPDGRTKPWGTGHALLAARDVIDAPFAVVNADDFYGLDGFRKIAAFLDDTRADESAYAMVAFELSKTLSKNGSVSRGICSIDEGGMLTDVVETTALQREADGVIRSDGAAYADGTPVSMNLWGFKPGFIGELERLFVPFLQERGAEMKSEFYIPFAVETLLKENRVTARVFRTSAEWFGVTNSADRATMVGKLAEFAKDGTYPRSLLA